MEALIHREKQPFNRKDIYLKKMEIRNFYDEQIKDSSNYLQKFKLMILKNIELLKISTLSNLYFSWCLEIWDFASFHSTFSGTWNKTNAKFLSLSSLQNFKRIFLVWQDCSILLNLEIFCSQSWSSTFSMRGSFATFVPTIKLFLYSFAFLGFLCKFTFSNSIGNQSWWGGLTGGLRGRATPD